MNYRTLSNVDTCGLTEGQIKEILTKVSMTRWNRQKGVLKCKNFERARIARELRNEFIRYNITVRYNIAESK